MDEDNVQKEETAEGSGQDAVENTADEAKDGSQEEVNDRDKKVEPSCCAAPSAKCAQLALVVLFILGAVLLIARVMSKPEGPVASTAKDAAKNPVVVQGKPAITLQDVDPDGALFLFVPGDDAAAAKKASGEVDLAVRKLRALKREISTITVDKKSSDYSWLVEDFGLEKFPAVVAVSKDNSTRVIDGEIKKEDLVRAFVTVACPHCGNPDCGGNCRK